MAGSPIGLLLAITYADAVVTVDSSSDTIIVKSALMPREHVLLSGSTSFSITGDFTQSIAHPFAKLVFVQFIYSTDNITWQGYSAIGSVPGSYTTVIGYSSRTDIHFFVSNTYSYAQTIYVNYAVYEDDLL